MTTGKLCLAALLGAMPAIASAQPSVSVDVGVNVGADNFDSVAPGDPVESVDVFYDQLSPYGVWVDEPDVGRVFIPDTSDYVPYTRGHWEYTNVGFVWASSEPFGWATAHYGRWAFSRSFGRWYWLPDTEWGPAWVEWRSAGDDFGWAPLAPEVVVRAGWEPPIESWHYCGASHVLDANVSRYYEPRTRVVEIHRQARPIEHFATVSNVKVNVGPPAAQLREHRVAVRPVKVEARTIGRWSAGEAHAQVERAQQHRATFEVQNQKRIEAKPQIHTAQVKVIESHPQIKEKVTARAQGHFETTPAAPNRAEPNRNEPARPVPGQPGQRNEPQRNELNRNAEPQHAQPNRPGEPQRNEPNRNAEPQHAQPNRPGEPQRSEPTRNAEPQHAPNRPAEPQRSEPKAPPPPQHEQPKAPPPPPQHEQPTRPEPQRNEPTRNAEPQHAPNRPAEPQRSEPRQPERPQPPAAQPERAQPQPPRAEPPRREPPRGSDRKEPDKKDDRKDSDKH